MATLLHVYAHPQAEVSITLRIAEAFLDSYHVTHPGDIIETLDLYAREIPHLTRAHMEAIALQDTPEKMWPEAARAWEETMELVSQFKAADKYVITAPMWNYGVPSILKAYIDHIVLSGHTFRYTGPGAHIGMLAGRPMVIISSHGGNYSQPPLADLEMCVRYLRNVFDFLGIEVMADIVSEGLALAGPHEQDLLLQPVLEQAREIARHFDLPEQRQRAA